MNYNAYIFYDFETTSKSKYSCQPVQLAAIAIDGRKLTILDKFESLIKPELDEAKCVEKNLDPLTEESIKVHGKTKELLKDAPELSVVWGNFTQFVNRQNPKKNQWNAPIQAGFNIRNYDSEIVRRCSEEFGPYDKVYNSSTLFHPFKMYDIIDDIDKWTENNVDIKSISMDSIREWFGISKVNAHDAMKDVEDGVAIMLKFIKLYRHFAPRVKFDNCFGGKTE
jgi:DNA polymerase III epsilon subunit-like protein